MFHLRNNKTYKPYNPYNSKFHNKRRVKPVLIISLIHHNFKRNREHKQEQKPPVVSLNIALFSCVRRIFNEFIRKRHNYYAYRNVNKINPVPRPVFGYPAAEYGAQNWRDNNHHAKNRACAVKLVTLKVFHHNSLCYRDKHTSAETLQKP